MTNQQSEITQQINALITEYKLASPERRAAIKKEIKPLYRQLPHRVGYCYNCNMRKALPDTDPHWNFCGAECHEDYGNREYSTSKFHRKRPTTHEMKQRLAAMAREEHMKKITNKQQRLIVE